MQLCAQVQVRSNCIKRTSLNQFEFPILLQESLTTGNSLDQKKTGRNSYFDTSWKNDIKNWTPKTIQRAQMSQFPIISTIRWEQFLKIQAVSMFHGNRKENLLMYEIVCEHVISGKQEMIHRAPQRSEISNQYDMFSTISRILKVACIK